MNKRSAMAIAAGLVAALLAGAISLAAGLSGGGTASATGPPQRREPRVRTIERTITIHKKAKAADAPVVRTIAAPAPAATQTQSAGLTDDDAYDHEFEDDEFEDDEFDEDDGEDGDD
jgi:hypothetical protein